MKKNLLFYFISWSFLMSITGVARAQRPLTDNSQEILTLGYCTSEVSTEGGGYGQAGQLAAAVYFPEERMKKLIGSKITKVKYGLVKNRMASVTVFIKDELTDEPLYKQTTTAKPQKGWNEMVLDIPFPIEGQGIYVGFEYTQIAQSSSFSFTGSDKPYGAFMAFDGGWINCYGKGYGSLSLQCTVEGENLPEYDIALSQAEALPYIPDGETFSLKNEIGNLGTATVKEIDLVYQINENEPVTIHKKVELISGSYQTVTLDNLTCPGSQVNSIKVKVTNLDEKPDEDESDNEKDIHIYSYSESYPRNILVEQFTTENCVNCPQGSAYLKEFLEPFSQVIRIAHHVGYGEDKYTIDASRSLLPLYGGSGLFAPAIMINRTAFEPEIYPVTGIYASAESMEAVINTATDVPAFVTVDISAGYEKEARRLSVEVTGEVLYLAGSDPKITVYLTEDSLYSTTQQGAGKEYIHNHVVRAALTADFGDSLVTNDNRYVFKKECDIPEKWKAEHLNVVALINNYDKLNVNNCKVLNVATTPMMVPDDIQNTVAPENVRVTVEGKQIWVTGNYSSYRIYTMQGQQVSNHNLTKGIYLVKVDSGSPSNGFLTVIEKVFVK